MFYLPGHRYLQVPCRKSSCCQVGACKLQGLLDFHQLQWQAFGIHLRLIPILNVFSTSTAVCVADLSEWTGSTVLTEAIAAGQQGSCREVVRCLIVEWYCGCEILYQLLDGLSHSPINYSGWWLSPLKNDGVKVTWDYYSQYMESHKIHVPNHQPVMGEKKNTLKKNIPNWWYRISLAHPQYSTDHPAVNEFQRFVDLVMFSTTWRWGAHLN